MSIRRMSTSTITQQERYPTMSTGTVLTILASHVIHGGGAGSNGGIAGVLTGSGGAAGVVRSDSLEIFRGVYSLEVGAGGSGVGPSSTGGAGGASQVFSVTATGGDAVPAALKTGGTNDDFDGGGDPGSTNGGGGAGAAENGSGVDGGDGFSSSITGSSVTRGGGGGGAAGGVGGAGGGGSANGGNGEVNTGSGGAGHNSTGVGGSGGSGVVLFSVPRGTEVEFSAGVTETSSTVGDDDVYTVTAAGPTDEVTIGF